jgi:protein kinase A
LSIQVQIKKTEIPVGWSRESADFINKLIQRKPAHRLGLNGPDEVKDHPWFKNFDWNKLYHKEIPSPFIPPHQEDNFDAKYINQDWKDANSE